MALLGRKKKGDDLAALGQGPELDRFDTLSEIKGGRGGKNPRRILMIAVTVLVFGGVLFYGYKKATRSGRPVTTATRTVKPPVIKAPRVSIKIKPKKPGGVSVPHRDKRVYDPLERPRRSATLSPPSPKRGEDLLRPMAPKTPKSGSVDKTGNRTSPKVAVPRTRMTPLKPLGPAPTTAAKPKPDTKTAALIGPYRAQLGAYRSQKLVFERWNRLQRKHKRLLGDLGLIIEKVDLGRRKGGVFYRMQAGPLQSRKAARALCKRLSKRRVPCFLVKT